MSLFPLRLKELRLKNKMTQDELGVVINFTRAAISGYEIGRNEPSIEDLDKLANYFSVTVDYLIGRTDRPELIVKEIGKDTKIHIHEDHVFDYSPEDLELAFKIIDLIKENKKYGKID